MEPDFVYDSNSSKKLFYTFLIKPACLSEKHFLYSGMDADQTKNKNIYYTLG